MQLILCNLLHWSYEKHAVPDVPEHVHSYFQLELCVHGVIKFTSGAGNKRIRDGEWMLIPPETQHSMVYEGKELEYYSFKFEVSPLPVKLERSVIFQSASNLSKWVIESLKTQRPPDRYLFMPINENRTILEALLLSMLLQALSPLPEQTLRNELVCTLEALIAAEGAAINVQSAAERMNLNTSQLKYRYALLRKCEPELAALTLKEFIDRELMRQIDRFLFYSDLSLSEIARQTKFNNIYTFSRFVRRLTGESPSDRRGKR